MKQGGKMKIMIGCIGMLAASLSFAQMAPVDSSSKEGTKNISAQESNIWEVFKDRRSVRQFKPDAVPESDILKMIDAARTAPTSGNQQPWKFLVVRDKGKIAKMKNACIDLAMERYEKGDKRETKEAFQERMQSIYGNYFSAPVYIIVLTDNRSMYPDYNHWDGPMAAGYLMLAARALGYGTVFITDSIPEEVTNNVLPIPDGYTRVCVTPVGIPVEWPVSPPKKKLGEFVSFDNLDTN
jgi:nitroreductase